MAIQNPDLNPFNLSPDDIRLMAGEITPDEMRLIKAVLNGIKAKLHNANVHSGMTHADGCWSWGPAHYMCAYNRVIEMSREHPAMTESEVDALAQSLSLDYEDVLRVVRKTEAHHAIGGAR